MAALNQLDGGLALADAALAQQQNALAVDLHQHAVAGDARRQVHLQGGDHRRHKIAGRKTGAQQRNLIGVGRRHHLLWDVQVAADDDRRHLLGKELIQKLLPLLGGVLFHIGKLAQTEQLDSVAVEIIIKSAQLQSRAVDVHRLNHDLLRVTGHIDRFQLQVFDQFGKRDRIQLCHKPSSSHAYQSRARENFLQKNLRQPFLFCKKESFLLYHILPFKETLRPNLFVFSLFFFFSRQNCGIIRGYEFSIF